ncbi:MAG: phytoene/squalene synthase family protein [Cytophagaceae bacterium]|nr:phytoene/squalene synthase family protein [Cytophagaceae bacterium]
METLFDTTALQCSRLITHHYSTSFSLGIRTLAPKFRMPVYAIYGFVRYADEIVDTFHGHNKADLLQRFKKDTYQAIEEKISLNPVLHAFQLAVNTYHIERELIDAFLYSMEMDLIPQSYDRLKYEQYIYGSAEVVGLMCLRVFCEGNAMQYQSLKPAAKHLGAAFQKVNFLRDIRSDFDDRSRVYFPGVDFHRFNADEKRKIEADIRLDFDKAFDGIKNLPKGSRLGVYLAYIYYRNLFSKIERLPADKILHERVRIPDSKKIILLLRTWIQDTFNVLSYS